MSDITMDGIINHATQIGLLVTALWAVITTTIAIVQRAIFKEMRESINSIAMQMIKNHDEIMKLKDETIVGRDRCAELRFNCAKNIENEFEKRFLDHSEKCRMKRMGDIPNESREARKLREGTGGY